MLLHIEQQESEPTDLDDEPLCQKLGLYPWQTVIIRTDKLVWTDCFQVTLCESETNTLFSISDGQQPPGFRSVTENRVYIRTDWGKNRQNGVSVTGEH